MMQPHPVAVLGCQVVQTLRQVQTPVSWYFVLITNTFRLRLREGHHEQSQCTLTNKENMTYYILAPPSRDLVSQHRPFASGLIP
jgi:hypothetical protein